MTTQVTVNGSQIAFQHDATLVDVVITTMTRPDGTLRDRGVAVAVNQEVVPRARWHTTPLRSDDMIEVVTAVQGG